MNKNLESQNSKKSNGNSINVTIQTPQGNWNTDFLKTMKISEIIQAIIDHFGFSSNGKYELKLDNDPNLVLDSNRPLVSYGVKDGDILVFIDFGQAV